MLLPSFDARLSIQHHYFVNPCTLYPPASCARFSIEENSTASGTGMMTIFIRNLEVDRDRVELSAEDLTSMLSHFLCNLCKKEC